MVLGAVVDAHVHLWSPSRLRYSWLSGTGEGLDRDFTAADLQAASSSSASARIVIVQSDDRYGDLFATLQAARRWGPGASVVGWLPLDQPGELTLALDTLASPELRGIRALSHTYTDQSWLAGSEVSRSARELASRGLLLEILTGTAEARAAAIRLGAACPDVELVIDHLGSPPVGGLSAEWCDFIEALAERPATMIKFSGLATRDGAARIDPEEWAASLQWVLARFGSERVMFGSDWPVSTRAGTYDEILGASQETVLALEPEALSDVFSGTAERVYRL